MRCAGAEKPNGTGHKVTPSVAWGDGRVYWPRRLIGWPVRIRLQSCARHRIMRRAMAKNIILCSDGTGNADIKGRGTNVFKLFEAVDLNEYRTNPELDAQIAFYDDGVGTHLPRPRQRGRHDVQPARRARPVLPLGAARRAQLLHAQRDQSLYSLDRAERIAHGTDDYAPGNVPPGATVAFTPPSDDDPVARQRKVGILQDRADAIKSVIDRAHEAGGYPLDSIKAEIRLGDGSYWMFVAGWAVLAYLTGAVGFDAVEHRHLEWHW